MDSYACLRDATSVAGLARLACSAGWLEALRKGLPRRKALVKGVLVGAALRGGAYFRCAPKEAGLNAVLRARACARLVVEGMGEQVLADVREADLAAFEAWLVATPREETATPLSNETIKRVLSFARRAISEMQRLLLGKARVRRRGARPTRPRAEVPERVRVTPSQFEAVVTGPGPAKVRMVIALAGACGMWEEELLSPRARDVSVQYCWVEYDNGHGGVRAEVPRWLAALIAEAFPNLAKMERNALLFPRRGGGGPRSSLYREVAAVCSAAGVEASLSDFRRLFQEVALSRGLPSAVVRGTWTNPGPGVPIPRRAATVTEELKSLARDWQEVGKPPFGTVRPPKRVPKAKPAGIGPMQMETDREARREGRRRKRVRASEREGEGRGGAQGTGGDAEHGSTSQGKGRG